MRKVILLIIAMAFLMGPVATVYAQSAENTVENVCGVYLNTSTGEYLVLTPNQVFYLMDKDGNLFHGEYGLYANNCILILRMPAGYALKFAIENNVLVLRKHNQETDKVINIKFEKQNISIDDFFKNL